MSASAGAMSEVRLELFRRVLDHCRAGTTDLAPGVMQIDPATYFDTDYFAREHQRLFRETPLLVCLSPDLPHPGDYLLFEDTGIPILVVRGEDGMVRAFLNVCAHRGGRVAREARGQAKRFTCRYHGWTYDSAGKVAGIPSREFFCGETQGNDRLVECPAEERHGMVFVLPSPGGVMNLDAHLGAFGEVLELFEFGASEFVIEEKFQSTSNWKMAMDTYLESYHLPTLHATSFAHVFESNLFLLDQFGPHYRFTFPHKGLAKWIGKPEAEWPIDALPITLFLYPNTIIAVGSVSANGSGFSTHRLFPRGVGAMHANVRMYGLGGIKSDEHRAQMLANFDKVREAARDEDYAVTGESWGGLSQLPADARFLLGRHEIGVQQFHRNIAAALGEA